MRLLFEYLTDSSVSPLKAEFVENDSPLASDVSFFHCRKIITIIM